MQFIIFSLVLVVFVHGSNFYMKDNKIYDKEGGFRLFHGVNLVEKVPPYYAKFQEEDAAKLKSWGMNGMRLGVMWPGVEPSQGQFNETYLQKMVQIVNLAGKHNIYTLVQFHQDLYSEKFCADGVPMWAIPKQVYQSFPRPLKWKKIPFDDKTGKPVSCPGPWAQYYFTLAVNKGFGNLWNNKNKLLEKFGNYWKKVAQTFKDNPYVIGFELVNEPWPGNLFNNPLIMVPGFSEMANLQSAYDYLAAQIRSVDPEQNICFQPVTWLNGFQSGFGHPPGGFKYSNSSIFCYHYYSPPTMNAEKFMKARLKDVKKLKSAAILSEFYIINKQGQQNVQIMDLCDTHSHSWFGWLYNQGNYIVQQVIRTYAFRVAGDIIQQSFNEKTKMYMLTFYYKSKTGETVIFINEKRNYPKGYEIEYFPKDKLVHTIEEGIYVKVSENGLQEGERVIITITAL